MIYQYLKPSLYLSLAPTGLAACNIDGVTLHSFAGVGLGTGTSDQLVIQLNNSHKYSKKNKTGKTAKERWISLKVLIIDEVSMLDGKFFDKLEHVARIIRCNSQPFGGIQLGKNKNHNNSNSASKMSVFSVLFFYLIFFSSIVWRFYATAACGQGWQSNSFCV